jgi:hypothetical protein
LLYVLSEVFQGDVEVKRRRPLLETDPYVGLTTETKCTANMEDNHKTTTRQDKTRQDKTREDNHKTRQDKTREDNHKIR